MNIRHKHYFFRILFLFLILTWLKIPIYSELTGTVTGKVIDEETGKGIKGVLIFLQSVGKNRYSHRSYRIETDNNDSFIIFEVEDGIYRIGFCPPSPYAWAKVNPPDYSTDEKISIEKCWKQYLNITAIGNLLADVRNRRFCTKCCML